MRAEFRQRRQRPGKLLRNDPWFQRAQADPLKALYGVYLTDQGQQFPVVPVSMTDWVLFHMLNAVGA